jgi:hypothetical protein
MRKENYGHVVCTQTRLELGISHKQQIHNHGEIGNSLMSEFGNTTYLSDKEATKSKPILEYEMPKNILKQTRD